MNIKISNRIQSKSLTEHDMGTVKPAGDNSGDKELRSIGVLSRVSHGEKPRDVVLELKVLI